MNNNVRYDNLDIARGLAMLVIIEWHAVGIHTSWSDGWAMPIFFVIMGIFYKQESSFKKMLVKKFNSVLFPLLVFSLPAFLLGVFSNGLLPMLKKVVNPYEVTHGVSWFLICTLWCYVISYILHKYIRKDVLRILLMLVLSLGSYYLSATYIYGHRIVLPLFVSTALTAQGYLAMGELCKNIFKNKGEVVHVIIAICLISTFFVFPSGKQDNYWNDFEDNWFKLISLATLQSYLIFTLCNYIPKMISILGRISILMLLIHPYFIQIYETLNLQIWLHYVLVVVSTTALSCLVYKYMPYFGGFKPVIKVPER